MMSSKFLRGLALVAVVMGAGILSAPPAADAQLGDILPTMERSRWLGCSVYNTPAGLVVRDIGHPSFAANLGLREGDLIYSIEGRRPRSVRQLHRYIFLGRHNMNRDVDILRMGRHVHAVFTHTEGAVNVVQPLR